MATGYILKKHDDKPTTLDRAVKRFLKSQGAGLVQNIENAGVAIGVYEIKDEGAIFYITADNGNDIPVHTTGKLVHYATAQISLLGFDQESERFRLLVQNLNTALGKYLA